MTSTKGIEIRVNILGTNVECTNVKCTDYYTIATE